MLRTSTAAVLLFAGAKALNIDDDLTVTNENNKFFGVERGIR